MLNSGLNPGVLNLASRQNPGGGVLNGAGAQEENIFRRTNLFMSLYRFAHYAENYGIKKSENNYPLNRNTGGIYSGNITVFRASEKNNPFKYVVFSIFEDNNSGKAHNPKGNVLPFFETFNEPN